MGFGIVAVILIGAAMLASVMSGPDIEEQ